jgi:hypothetical protein
MANIKDVYVKVFVHKGGPDGDFHFETTDLPMGPNNHLVFRNCDNDGFYVHYEIQGGAYLFPSDKDDAVYSQNQLGCPSTKQQWGQFKGWDVQKGGQTLVVWNKNRTSQDFGYTLNVSADGKPPFLPLDPGGTNENGSYNMNVASLSLALFGGAIAGSLLTLGVQSIMGS